MRLSNSKSNNDGQRSNGSQQIIMRNLNASWDASYEAILKASIHWDGRSVSVPNKNVKISSKTMVRKDCHQHFSIPKQISKQQTRNNKLVDNLDEVWDMHKYSLRLVSMPEPAVIMNTAECLPMKRDKRCVMMILRHADSHLVINLAPEPDCTG